MTKAHHVLLKSFWDLYDHAVPFFILSLFWLAAGLPWLAAAVFVYAVYPGLDLGILTLVPLLKFNPATLAWYRYAHRTLYEHSRPRLREYFSLMKGGLFRTGALMVMYLVPAALLYLQFRSFGPRAAPGGPVRLLLLINVCIYGILLVMQVFFLPQEAFRRRPLRELVSQSFILTGSAVTLSGGVFLVSLVLGFFTVRFGVMVVFFIPITVVLELNLLYYVYARHGKIPVPECPRRSFSELLRPFGGKI